ncbi:hypothetical protein [Actimicrobium sp. CCI2.3]|uniref:hypothetical protein n=1 Tax=Actimicrobium sp. CCI2.3 TaxID=3048616 RepID=UPI002AB4CE88|nr:hypothetical protein [Actimicrobium sp. CCI2.3]MDY7573134.1 hypothetical protein [Actimicrobium sp. CCI2.3]MEB0021128.1 hypothetical protein [Actimicrobium sp. CCI2.3]
MHIEILSEDSSGKKLLEALMPQLLGVQGEPHTWRINAYKGIGRVPAGLTAKGDAANRILLDQLPRLLRGYAMTPGYEAIVVVMDADDQIPKVMLDKLNALALKCNAAEITRFCLAIEETESWYLGDREALLKAYPRAKKDVLVRYVQDSICGTWELLADAVYPGGAAAVKKEGWPLPGQIKHEWAEKMGPLMVVERNVSPSFGNVCAQLRHLIS